MKVAVINFSGNVGKSTVSKHLLAPRMKNAPIIAVESINANGLDDEAMKGKQFGELQEGLLLMDDAVIDIGSSNVEDFTNLMKQYHGSHEDFDYFVVPTVPKAKQQRDTISTIDTLAEIGVPAKKIRVLFNMVEIDEEPESVFSGIMDFHRETKGFMVNNRSVIHVNDIYGKIKEGSQSMAEILDDKTDVKEMIKTAESQEQKVRYAEQLSIKRLAAGVSVELDNVFRALFQ